MGKVLQIRVSAWTYDEDEVARTWPQLTALVWPEGGSWTVAGSRHGVMELAEALPDVVRFGDWPEDTRRLLQEGVARVSAAASSLREALANWQPREANQWSDTLEEALSALEQTVPSESGGQRRS